MKDLFKDRLSSVDDLLLQAIRAVFEKIAEESKPDIGEADNKLLGEKYRAYLSAKKMIEQGFKRVASYKSEPKKITQFNKER